MRKGIVVGVGVAVLATSVLPTAGADHHEVPLGGTRTIVFNGEGNNLDIYDATDLSNVRSRTLVPAANESDPDSRDMNAQICFKRFDDGRLFFINGEDTAQGGAGDPGWGWFEVTGDTFDELKATQAGKLTPDYVENQVSGEENYGCGFLSNGNLVTSEVGDQYPGTPNTGELILWFHDGAGGFTQGFGYDDDGIPHGTVPSCHLDTGVATSGGILVRQEGGEDVVYLASNRPGNDGETGGVFRYSNIPSTPEECAAGGVTKEMVIVGAPLTGITPSALAEGPDGHLYMSSVFDGVISEWEQVETPLGTTQWVWVRNLIAPPAGTPLPQLSDTGGVVDPALTTEAMYGTPFGIGVGPDGTVYYADIGIFLAVPVPGAGDVYAITFDGGEPNPPQRLNTEGQEFPDGIGVIQLELTG